MSRVTKQHTARSSLERGIALATNTIKLTLGPAGRNVVLSQESGPTRIVNDGVTIAREIELSDRAENLGVQLIREICIKTHDAVGDGTTTAAVLAQAIISEGLRNISSGANPVVIRSAINEASSIVIEYLKTLARPVEDSASIARIATLSGGNDEDIGNAIAHALAKVGKEGVLVIEESKSVSTTFEYSSGMQFDRGFTSSYLITDNERMESVFDEPLILLIDQNISIVPDVVPVLEEVSKLGKPILIIAHDVTGEALATLVINHMSGTLHSCAVRAPDFGEERREALEDIASLVGGEIISSERGTGLEKVTIGQLGKARKTHVTKDNTTLVVDQPGPAFQEHLSAIKYGIEHARSESEKQKFRRRLARLTGGLGVIKVGAHTETELKDRKLRFENALNASLSAMEAGYVPGGGTALIRASQHLLEAVGGATSDRRIGMEVLRKALEAPLAQIAENAGLPGEVAVQKVKEIEGWTGFDAVSLTYVDTAEAGIIDSTKVVETAIRNAVSVASLVLTTEAVVVESE